MLARRKVHFQSHPSARRNVHHLLASSGFLRLPKARTLEVYEDISVRRHRQTGVCT